MTVSWVNSPLVFLDGLHVSYLGDKIIVEVFKDFDLIANYFLLYFIVCKIDL